MIQHLEHKKKKRSEPDFHSVNITYRCRQSRTDPSFSGFHQLRPNSIVCVYVPRVYIYLAVCVCVGVWMCHFRADLLSVPTPKLNKPPDTLTAALSR